MEEVSATATVGQIVAGILGAGTALPLMLFPSVILGCVGAQEDVAKEAAGCFQLFAASAPLTAISAVTTATFRSLNDSKTPMMR
jgi:Na+-driven multidrug efflux pump